MIGTTELILVFSVTALLGIATLPVLWLGAGDALYRRRRLRQRRRSLARSKSTPGPMCQCEHGLAYHNKPTKDQDGTHCREYYCPCQQYIGPMPLPDFYAPEIIDIDNPRGEDP